MKTHYLLLLNTVALMLAGTLLTACDSTPRERQEVVRQEVGRLDTLTNQAGRKLSTAARRVARYGSAARLRAAQPLDPKALKTFTSQLLGTYATVERLTPTTIAPAYTQLLRETRARRREWTQRDWDYATTIYRRLNDQLKKIRLDVKARDEVRIRALQTEFKTLETSRDVRDVSRAARAK